LKCCGREINKFDRIIYLYDQENKSGRQIRILNECPVCGAFLAELQYFDTVKGHLVFERPKRKHTVEWLKTFLREKYIENVIEEVKYGTMANMTWKFQFFGSVYDHNKTLLHWNGHFYSTLET